MLNTLKGRSQTIETSTIVTFRRVGVLTTGQVAKLIGVAPRTVSQWADNNKIKCYRLPSTDGVDHRQGNGDWTDRRFYLDDVLKFMKKYEIRIPAEIDDSSEIVAYGLGNYNLLPERVKVITSPIQFGVYCGSSYRCRSVLLGTNLGYGVLKEMADTLKEEQSQAIIGIVFHDSEQLRYDECDFADLKYLGENQNYSEIVRQLDDFCRPNVKTIALRK